MHIDTNQLADLTQDFPSLCQHPNGRNEKLNLQESYK